MPFPRGAIAAGLVAALALRAGPARAVDPDAPAPPRPAVPRPDEPSDDLPSWLARVAGFQGVPETRPERRFHFAVLPFVVTNPLMGLGFGTAFLSDLRLGPPGSAYSTLDASAFTSERGQRGIAIRSDVRPPGRGWILVGDWGLGRFPNPAWGLGGDTPASNLTYVHRDQVQLHETVFRRAMGDLYAGVGWFVDDFYDIQDSRSAAGLPSAFADYGPGTRGRSFSSQLAWNLLWDGRDDALAPTRGVYALARWRTAPRWLGSDTDFRSLYLDVRGYVPVPGRRDVVALWTYAWSTFGTTPYLLLPQLGADPEHRSGRGYVEGRYAAKDLLYAEVEYRAHVWEWLGAAAAVNLDAPSNRGTGLPGHRFDDLHVGFALGVRALLSRASRASLALDAAWAPGGTLRVYLNANETF